MKWKLLIFDLDGTLIDTISDLGTAVNHALSGQNFPTHPIDAYKLMVGHGVKALVREAMPEELKTDESLFNILYEDFLKYYSSHIQVYTQAYPDMANILGELQDSGVKLAVASNKFQNGTELLVRHFFPGIHFCAILGDRPNAPLKPDPAIISEIMEKAGLEENTDRKSIALVGDSGTDMKTAANASICGIAVTWGFQPDAARAGASLIADTPEELRKLLA